MEPIKKIVFTVTNDLTYDQRMHRICTSLAQQGYRVLLIGFFKKRSIKTGEKLFQQKRVKVFFKKGKFFYLEYNLKLFFTLLFSKFDIYCAIDLDTLVPVFLNARIKRKPIVYDAHEYFTELPEIVTRPRIKKFWLRIEKIFLPRIKYNYTVGGCIAKELSNKYQTKFEVIRNVPVLTHTDTHPNHSNYLLYQGALNLGRGIQQMMQAMEFISLDLYIAGEGDLSEELRIFHSKLVYKERIRFLGYVKPDELKKITASAFAGINLVENLGLSYYFSLSNKFFDYIHAGVPQITMDFPEYTKLNKEYDVALLVDNIEPQTLTTAFQNLIQNPELYQRLASNTEIAKAELNWQIEEKKLIQFYQAIGT